MELLLRRTLERPVFWSAVLGLLVDQRKCKKWEKYPGGHAKLQILWAAEKLELPTRRFGCGKKLLQLKVLVVFAKLAKRLFFLLNNNNAQILFVKENSWKRVFSF